MPSQHSVTPTSTQLLAATEALSTEVKAANRGAYYTKPEIVDFILDLVGYTPDKPLYTYSVLEPSFGEGDFLIPIINRLLTSLRNSNKHTDNSLKDISGAIRAFEVHNDTYYETHSKIVKILHHEGLCQNSSTNLTNTWLIKGDFLQAPFEDKFDFVVGNPPYVRQELIPQSLVSIYRNLYPTMYDRADIYVPFIERSLTALSEKGCFGFICADRWTKNKYGGPLRKFVSDKFSLKTYIDMTHASAFNSEVQAYPAITIITHKSKRAIRIANCSAIDPATLTNLSKLLNAKILPKGCSTVREVTNVINGSEPWLLGSDDQMKLIRRLEQLFPTIEEAGCKVGIGVATGADKAFIGNYDELDVETDRKLPLVMTKDILSGEVQWQGKGVINPFTSSGKLINLDDYPLLQKYLEEHKDMIKRRHCVVKAPNNWYRTIDRIHPDLANKQKLLIPDIKGNAHIVFESGKLYPHHNLYFITASQWDLRALQAVLLSAVSRLFISIYSTKMRGGFLRFQAQYLRRIRIPHWSNVPEDLRNDLSKAAINRDLDACNRAVFDMYGLDSVEKAIVGGNGEN